MTRLKPTPLLLLFWTKPMLSRGSSVKGVLGFGRESEDGDRDVHSS